VKEAKHDLQVELDRLNAEVDGLKASAVDANRLQSTVADLEAKLKDTEEKFNEQSALVCLFFHIH